MPARFPFPYDWKNPDVDAVIRWRIEKLQWIRNNPESLPALKAYYRDHIPDFITDFGWTYDPRNVERGLPAKLPFVLFPKQREMVEWVIDKWKRQDPGLVNKSRDMGVSWLVVALGCSMCIFFENLTLGYGSRKEEYVDKIGHPKALFWKAREFMKMLPPEFRGQWDERKNTAHMRISFPHTGSVMTGEAGDSIGRGDRTAIYFVDESAHIERPQLIDMALSATTNCRIDVSSVNGMANSFAVKLHGGKIDVFVFDWRDDPRKSQAWYDKQCEILDPVTVAQEIDRNCNASAENVIIPGEWIQAAINSHIRLGIDPTGNKTAGLDVADEGKDKNALAARYGPLLYELEEWSGKQGDIFDTTVKAFNYLSLWQVYELLYDNDGLGAGVRGDARVMNDARIARDLRPITIVKFQGSGSVVDPGRKIFPGSDRTNDDYYLNLKAQSWFSLRRRFEKTYKAVVLKQPFRTDEIISISSGLKLLSQLTMELSQPVYGLNNDGKVIVDKTPDGLKSPNLADAVMIAYSPVKRQFNPNMDELLQSIKNAK